MLPEDIRRDHSKGSSRGQRNGRGGRASGRGGRGIGESSRANFQREGDDNDEIELYDIRQLGNMVMKVLEAPTQDLLKEAENHLEKQKYYVNVGLRAIAKKAATIGAEGPAQNPSVPRDDGGQGGDIHGGGDDEIESGDDRNTNFDDDKRGGISSGSGRSTSGAASGSQRTGSGSGSGRGTSGAASGSKRNGSSSSGRSGSSSSGNSGHSGDGIGNSSDTDNSGDSDD